MLHYILGITKAYCTRVGGGPFPTELDWEKEGTPGWHMSTVGAEKGVTTGRSRRCGWFDAALLKRSAQVNGLSGLCITKLDVLDGLQELLLCVGYELDGERSEEHTSELQSQSNLVCRLLLEKKKKINRLEG